MQENKAEVTRELAAEILSKTVVQYVQYSTVQKCTVA